MNYASGKHYGSYRKPIENGSGGGGSNAGAGGGIIKMVIGRYFHLDGKLIADGDSATGSHGGGGSGGSIDVDVLTFSGHGMSHQQFMQYSVETVQEMTEIIRLLMHLYFAPLFFFL